MEIHASRERQGTTKNRKPTYIDFGKKYPRRDRLNRRLPKVGMIGSLGTLVFSGLIRFKGAKSLHVWAGVAFVGFSIWHNMQNKPKMKKT